MFLKIFFSSFKLKLIYHRVIANLKATQTFKKKYKQQFKKMKKEVTDFVVTKEFRYDIDSHPVSRFDFECMFASKIIAQKKPTSILDIGSFRIFIIGLLSFYKITTIDLRKRKSFLKNETIITRDAKNLLLPDNSFDIVVSLSCLPHLGLGRYGDKLDLDADKKVFKEIIRVLKPGGILIFSSYITKRSPFIAFNAHKTYNYRMVKALCNGLEFREEKFYSFEKNSYCSLDQITDKKNCYDIYCGCWVKKY